MTRVSNFTRQKCMERNKHNVRSLLTNDINISRERGGL